MTALSTRLRRVRTWAFSQHADDWLAVVGMFVIVLIIWLPFGLSIPPSYDGWLMTQAADQGIVIQPGESRFLTYVPGAIARVLSPNPFIGANVFLIGLFVGKVILVYLIVKRLTRNRAVAFAAASLIAVYPADTAIFYAAPNIHFAIFFYVLSVYLLLVYWDRPRWYLLLFMWFAQVMTTGTYEAVYPLLILTPLVVVWLEGRVTRRVITTAVLWYAAPVLVLVRLTLIVIQNQGAVAYQQHLFTTAPIHDLLGSLLRAYRVHFIDGWTRIPGSTYIPYGVIAGVIGGGICWRLLRKQPSVRLRTLILLLIGGLAAIGAGYVPFLLTSLRDSSARTYNYSSLGAGFVLAILFLAIAQRLKFTRFLFAALTAVLLAHGTVQLLNQHGMDDERGRAQVTRVLAVIAQAPAVQPGSLVLVIDETEGGGFSAPFGTLRPYFELALSTMYENYTLSASACYPKDEAPRGAFQENCHIETDRVVLTILNGSQEQSFPLDQVVVFRYHPDGSVSLDENLVPYVTDASGYDPKKRINFDAPLPPRAQAMLNYNGQGSQP